MILAVPGAHPEAKLAEDVSGPAPNYPAQLNFTLAQVHLGDEAGVSTKAPAQVAEVE